MLRVEKVKAHAAFWENLWAKAGPNRASIDSPEKKIMLDYQLTVFTARCYAERGIAMASCLAVRLSVCP